MLENLTNEQLDQVYDWLLDMPTKQVVEKVALPAPEGFGITTHVTTLRRFKEKRWAELAADRIQAATQLAGTANQPSQLETLDTGIQVAIKHHMFQRVSSPNITDDQLAIVSRWSHRQEKLKLEIQRVQIARERCAQNNLRLQLLTSRRLNPTLNLNPNRFTGRDAERVSAQVNISSGVFHPSPTSISPQLEIRHQKTEMDSSSAIEPSPLPSLPSVNGTPASPSQSDIRDQKSETSAPSADLNSAPVRNAHESLPVLACTHHSPLNLISLLKEFTDSVKAAGGHLPPPPEEENSAPPPMPDAGNTLASADAPC